MLITLTDAFGTAEEEMDSVSCFSSALIDSLLKLRLLSLNFETKNTQLFSRVLFAVVCVYVFAFTFARLCCFSLADNEYGNRYARSESNKANDNPNPSVRRIARRNRESGGGVTAGRANGQCVPALRKCLKIACFQLNDDTALLPFIIFGGDGLSVHKQLDKVGDAASELKVSPFSSPFLHSPFAPSRIDGASFFVTVSSERISCFPSASAKSLPQAVQRQCATVPVLAAVAGTASTASIPI